MFITAYELDGDYLIRSAIRQDYLQTAIRWISKNNIEDYMSTHQHQQNANELWLYFTSVINWIKVLFSNYCKEMKDVEWELYYNEYKDGNFDSNKLEQRIKELMVDEDVTSKKCIY